MNQINPHPNRLHSPRVFLRSAPWSAIVVTLLFSLAAMGAPLLVIKVPAKAGGEGIQKALDSMPQGGEVDLEAGVYVVRQPIILQHDHQALRGTGPGTVLYLADRANCPVVILGSPVNHPAGPTSDLLLSSVLIDGNRTKQQRELWRALFGGADVINNGVDVWNSEGVTVEHVVCCHCRSGGMVTSARTRRLTVNDFTAFDNQFDGLACYLTEESHFSKLYLHDNLAAGISLDLNFDHNVIDGAILSSNDLGLFMRQSRNNSFQGLTIEKCRHHGVFMAQTTAFTPLGWRSCPGTECTGNSFDRILITDCGGKAFLVNDASCKDNIIDSGRFFDNAQGGLVQAPTNPVTVRALIQQRESKQEALMIPLVPVVHQSVVHTADDHNSSKTL